MYVCVYKDIDIREVEAAMVGVIYKIKALLNAFINNMLLHW